MTNSSDYKQLPKHLKVLIVKHDYKRYTAQDQAVWRAVMKRNINYLFDVAHPAYVEGLLKTGISKTKIPHIDEMNDCLARIGWAAAIVDGFIPPAAFMEFQKYRVLVIAADIRTVDQIDYTPAPDIIHEAAGHAPIIADKEYASYLQYFGEIGSKAFSSSSDYRIYKAIRHLSILKADPGISLIDVQAAEERLKYEINNAGGVSEMSLIRNLHWWTVEYGLFGDREKPMIYGAGLLSSIGESQSALTNKVRKINYTTDAANFNFDITVPQPQLFVTPDFAHLTKVLNDFSETMALKRGGLEGLEKARESGSIATVEYSSGLQVSGVLTEIKMNNDKAAYLRFGGPVNLNYGFSEIAGEGVDIHSHGFGSPVGKLKGVAIPLEKMSDSDLLRIGINRGKNVFIKFESGVCVSGKLNRIVRESGAIILLKFENCLVTHNDSVYFDPSWGIYDMAVGESIKSVFSGPADPDSYGINIEVPSEKTHKILYHDSQKNLHNLYSEVAAIRKEDKDISQLQQIWDEIKSGYKSEWLLPVEIFEILSDTENHTILKKEVTEYLKDIREHIDGASLVIDSVI